MVVLFDVLFPDEEIDGEAYLGLTETIMANQLHLKAGQMIKINKHLHSLNNCVSFVDVVCNANKFLFFSNHFSRYRIKS